MQTITIGEAKGFVGRDYNEQVSREFNSKYEGRGDNEEITYQDLMGNLSQTLGDLGYTGKASLVRMREEI
jgi:hypothetical protein